MRNDDRRRYEMLARVRDFGASYGSVFPASSLASAAFAAVSAAIADIDGHEVSETAAAVSARASHQRDARDALRQQLQLVAHTAEVLPGQDEGFIAQFRVPGVRSDQGLVKAARRFLQCATPVAAQFVAHGMPETFPSEFGASIDRFEEAVRARGLSRDQVAAARRSIRDAMDSALQAIAQLDVMVANHLASNLVVSDAWKRARRLGTAVKARRPASTGVDPAVSPPDSNPPTEGQGIHAESPAAAPAATA